MHELILVDLFVQGAGCIKYAVKAWQGGTKYQVRIRSSVELSRISLLFNVLGAPFDSVLKQSVVDI